MNGDNSLREALKRARKKQKWTQENLAAIVSYSRSQIANIETGSRPTAEVLRRIIEAFPEEYRSGLLHTIEAREIIANGEIDAGTGPETPEDMVKTFITFRRTDIDLSGQWNAMWLTTVDRMENRNRETVNVRKRWNGSWEFSNEAISADNPDGGYLWVARLELFDNKHILGYYCARDRAVLAKGTLCLELQSNGREILGVWDGLNFDQMWATGMVAMCKASQGKSDPGAALDRFISSRPKMPY